MADAKISGLSELTSPANGDLIPIVDVSDTTQAVSGTTKYIQKSNLAPSAVWSLLEEVACASQTYIDFNGDGSNYTDLTDTNFEEFRIVFDGVVPSATSEGQCYIIDNGSRITSGSAYHYHELALLDSTPTPTNNNSAGVNTGYFHKRSHAAAGKLFGEILIPRFTATEYPEWMSNILLWASSSSLARAMLMCGANSAYSTIEGVSLKRSTGNWGTSGSVKLYGRAA